MVKDESLQVLEARTREEESIDSRPKLLECKVRRCEQSAAWVVSRVELIVKISLGKTKLESGELCREEVDDLNDLWWGQ